MPYYLCDNFGKCELADNGEPIELAPGAEPICPAPTCREPLSPAGGSNHDLAFLASLDDPERGGRRLLCCIGLILLLVTGLVGGIIYLLSSPPVVFHADRSRFGPASASTAVVIDEKRGGSPALTLWAEPKVLGRVGTLLDVPIGIGPAGMKGVTIGVQGDLPAGVSLDTSGKRLYGTPESAGSFDVLLTASAPGYDSALAPMILTISEAKPTLAPAELPSNPPGREALAPSPAVQVGVAPSPAVQPETAARLVKPPPTPARVADNASEDILTAPDLGDEAAPALRKALRNCDRVALGFQFDRREFVTLDRRSVQNLNRLVAFLRKPGMSKRHLVVIGCADGAGTQLENSFYARSRAVAFVNYLQEAGIKNPIEQLLSSSGDYLALRRDSSAGEPQSDRRVDVYLKR